MIKGYNLNDMSKLYLTLHEVDSLHSEKVGRFHRIKNKEQGRDRKCLIGWGHTINLAGGVKAQRWLGIWGLTDRIYCVSGQAEHFQLMEVISVSVC